MHAALDLRKAGAHAWRRAPQTSRGVWCRYQRRKNDARAYVLGRDSQRAHDRTSSAAEQYTRPKEGRGRLVRGTRTARRQRCVGKAARRSVTDRMAAAEVWDRFRDVRLVEPQAVRKYASTRTSARPSQRREDPREAGSGGENR